MHYADMMANIASGDGFIAALDQSGGSTPKALKGYGVEEGAWNSDEEMFGLIHEMRCRIIRAGSFTGKKVIGAILFERTMNGNVDGMPVPAALIAQGVVPFLKIDQGLEAEGFGGFGGVQLMKPIKGLDALLTHAKSLGVFGTKERSVINSASRSGIAAVVAQQFELAARVLAHGLMPIIEPEVNITSETRAECDAILLDELHKALDAVPAGTQVMLKVSLPVEAGMFAPLTAHPAVLRVVALSGGYSRADACTELARNHGIIASFSRALLEDLRHPMSTEEFDAALGTAIDEIHQGSTVKASA